MQIAGVSGRVELELVLSAEGVPEPESIRVVSSTMMGRTRFEAAAISFIRRCRFQPGYVGDTPVRVLIRYPVEFKLADTVQEIPTQ